VPTTIATYVAPEVVDLDLDMNVNMNATVVIVDDVSTLLAF